ncbi:asparagine synthase (glutamine-hydrolyzing) [Coprobacter tertius]|uniref:asparagine synthase (glutamine-hydrolyzing) n=1 Tax=Coprobacter tertius TaxID=2944915 RepID=A0ABT1MKW3_9BACT|nr:asparagine synthase (glutamine-hydrolyzing) [Coprobacter tertius]MCP9613049.1 asparagine synthase (glutamine-hydrolyzing) [Coprobacter tertius]
MCGLAGIAGETENMDKLLNKMIKIQEHRGPDGSDTWASWFCDARIGLAHSRLTVRKRAETEIQPYLDEDTGIVIMFDGNIHNYKDIYKQLEDHYPFRSGSMSEVVAKAYHRWGRNLSEHLEGTFSLVVYDRSGKQLFITRDHFGIKPLYFALQKGNFYFASEIKALFAAGVNRQMSPHRWSSYLTYASYGMPYETFWENVYQLPAGHSLFFDGFSLDVWQWYDFKQAVSEIAVPNNEKPAAERLLSLADNAILSNLDTDVPIGINLSGGIDSSFLLGLLNRHCDIPLQIYSYYSGDKLDDEILWTEEMISHTPYRLEQVRMTAEMVKTEARYIARIQDEPFDGIDSLAYARLFRIARKRGTIVLCDGLGLDEVWGEYPHRNHNIQAVSDESICLRSDFKELARSPEAPAPFNTEYENQRYYDLFYGNIPHQLRFHDRVSMAYSTELRKPFLDHKLVEYAFAVPERLKLQNHTDKWLIRKLSSRMLPSDTRLAPERKVAKNQKNWLVNELKEWVDDSVSGLRNGKISHWIDGDHLEKEWKHYKDGTIDCDVMRVWRWLNLHILLNNE